MIGGVVLLILITVGVLLLRWNAASSVQVPAAVGTPAPRVERTAPNKSGDVAAPARPAVTPAAASSQAAEPAASESESTDEKQPTIEIRGRVTSAATGDPIEGAVVSLVGMEGYESLNTIPPVEATATTDGDGFYALTGYEKGVAGMFANGTRMLRAEAATYASVGAMVEGQGGKSVTKNFSLPYGSAISGQVVNEAGVGIPGAFVGNAMLGEISLVSMAQGLQAFRSAYTKADEAGLFRLEGIAEGESLKIPARADGYLPTLAGPFEAGASGVEIVLNTGTARMFGQVLDADGEPLEEAFVSAIAMQGMMMGSLSELTANQFLDKTDAEGRYELDPLATGTLMVVVMEDVQGFSPDSMLIQEMVTLAEGQALEKDFRIEAPAIATGRAIDTATGKGLAGVRVSNQPYREFGAMGGLSVPEVDARTQEVITGEDGAFEIPVRSLGMVSMIFYDAPAGYIQETLQQGMPAGMQVIENAKPGTEIPPIELSFRQGVVLSGRVLEPGGEQPAQGATVKLMEPANFFPPQTTTDEQGVFSLTSKGGLTVQLEAKSESGFVSRETAVPQSGELEDIELELLQYAVVSGYVTDPAGKPVLNANVRFQTKGNLPTRGMMNMTPSGTLTDGQGFYYAEQVPPTGVELVVAPPEGSEYTQSAPMELTLEPGELRENVDVKLSPGDYIEGVVTDADGEPIKGAMIMAQSYSTTGGLKQATTDDKGYYRIKGIPQDSTVQWLHANHPEYERVQKQNVTIYDNPQNFTMKKLGAPQLLAVDGQGNPVAHFEYRLLKKGWNGDYQSNPMQPGGRVQDAGGKTDLPTLEAGDWRVDVAVLGEDGKAAGPRGSKAFKAVAGAAAMTVEVVVDSGLTLEGRVVRQVEEGDPEPVAGVLVAIAKPTSAFGTGATVGDSLFDVPDATSDAKGAFKLEGLSEGVHKLVVSAEELYAPNDISVTLPRAEDAEPFVIVLAEGGTVFGKVIGEDGQPFKEARMTRAHRGSGWRLDPSTSFGPEEDGTYRVEKLEPGQWQFALRDEASGISEEKWVTVEAGKEHELDFRYDTKVLLTGTIRYKGTDWPAMLNLQLMLTKPDGTTSGSGMLQRKGASSYEIRVEPGTGWLMVYGAGGSLGRTESFEIAAEPRQQTMDFEFNPVPIDIAIAVEDTANFPQGRIEVLQEIDEETKYTMTSMVIESPKRRIGEALPGMYTATFTSDDGSLKGESEVTEIGPGLENVIVIFPEKIERVKIGEWTSDTISTEFAEFTWEIGALLNGDPSASFAIEINYENGANAVAIEWVALSSGGTELDRDTHEGWSGFSNRQNTYSFEGVDASRGGLTVKVRMRSDGGTDSQGTVYLVTSGL
ncbi:MAG: hypothetical protein PWP23_2157 [Candidatus Sumerlaeota bacterium]|nr:hypothetical protein [Candidatus Sumerlaeota bacterium]